MLGTPAPPNQPLVSVIAPLITTLLADYPTTAHFYGVVVLVLVVASVEVEVGPPYLIPLGTNHSHADVGAIAPQSLSLLGLATPGRIRRIGGWEGKPGQAERGMLLRTYHYFVQYTTLY